MPLLINGDKVAPEMTVTKPVCVDEEVKVISWRILSVLSIIACLASLTSDFESEAIAETAETATFDIDFNPFFVIEPSIEPVTDDAAEREDAFGKLNLKFILQEKESVEIQ